MSREDSKAVGPGKSRIAFLFVGSTDLLHDVIHGAGLVSDGNPAGVYFGKCRIITGRGQRFLFLIIMYSLINGKENLM